MTVHLMTTLNGTHTHLSYSNGNCIVESELVNNAGMAQLKASQTL